MKDNKSHHNLIMYKSQYMYIYILLELWLTFHVKDFDATRTFFYCNIANIPVVVHWKETKLCCTM